MPNPKLSDSMVRQLRWTADLVVTGNEVTSNGKNRTVNALVDRGLVRFVDLAVLTVGSRYGVELTDAGWDYLKAEFDMQRPTTAEKVETPAAPVAAKKTQRPAPADPDRLTVDQAWEDTVVDFRGRMLSWSEAVRRFRKAVRAGGSFTAPEKDPSGITLFLVSLGMVTKVHVSGDVSGYQMTSAGWIAASADRPFWQDEEEDGDVAALAALAARAIANMKALRQETAASDPTGDLTGTQVTGVLDVPLTAGQAVEVRRSTFDTAARSWVPQPSFSATYYGGPVRNGFHLVLEDAHGTAVRVRRQEIYPESRLPLSDALTLADMMRRTAISVDGHFAPAGWPTV